MIYWSSRRPLSPPAADLSKTGMPYAAAVWSNAENVIATSSRDPILFRYVNVLGLPKKRNGALFFSYRNVE